jgi:hypothetical protein
MSEPSLLQRAFTTLQTLVWCHENERSHLLGHAEFTRQFDQAWRDAATFLEDEAAAGVGPPPPPQAGSITREDLARFLGEAIKAEIHDEGALVWQARSKVSDDPEVPLAGPEDAETVGTIIWERGDTGDIAQAAKNCGAILAYFYIARHFEIAFPPEVKALEEWGDTINPA